MQGKLTYIILFCCIGSWLLLGACTKTDLLTNGGYLRFSQDTLKFDTVFTAQGSFTREMNIFNPQGQKIKLSSVRLEKGANSPFSLNVDGFQGNDLKNIEIQANDSIYVFATVNIDPTSANSPFMIEDRLIITLNGQEYYVPFTAYGQNAHYVVDSVLRTQTWDTIRPYVIIHNAFVAQGETLTIPAGCKVYMHQDSKLYVYGTLKINGTLKDSVIFQGDRLDRTYFGYKGYPGEWGGIYFDSYSTGSVMKYTVLKNCGNGTSYNGQSGIPAAIQLAPDSVNGPKPQVVLDHCSIYNSIGYGIFSFQGSVHADNCLIHTCGAQAVGLIRGGNDTFNHCTFANYSSYAVNHTSDNPTVAALNYYDIDNTNYVTGNLHAVFRNCVVWGSQNNEFFMNKKGTADYQLKLYNCLIKNFDTGTIPTYVDTIGCLLNVGPKFADSTKWNFRPTASSPMVDKGVAIPFIIDDLDGNPRTGLSDIGCYEFKP
jgi:hypothetical protein